MHRACNRDAASSTICRQEERVGGTLDFDLHDVGAEPGQRLGDRRASLELGEIDDFDAGKGRFAAWGATHLRILHVEPVGGRAPHITNGELRSHSILTLAAFIRSPMLSKSSLKYLRKSGKFWTTGTADLSPVALLSNRSGTS